MGRVQWKEADELTTTSNFHGYTGRHQKMRDRYCFLDVIQFYAPSGKRDSHDIGC